MRLLRNRCSQPDAAPRSPTRTEQAVLSWLESHETLTPSQLAALEHVRLQSVGQTVDSLEKRQWISRGAHPEDRRRVLISITKAGRQALSRSRTNRQKWLEETMDVLLNEHERHELMTAIKLLERIVQS